jgi:hypothetical protein
MKIPIGIFKGKQAKNNMYLLKTLYTTGPLTAWDLTKTVRENNRMSIHAIFTKRLRKLEKKGYVQKVGKKWVLHFKGIIAVLIVLPEPKPWNEKWTNIFEEYAKPLADSPKKYTLNEDGKEIANLNDFAINTPIVAREFERWEILADYVKKLINKGLINLDVIKNESLLSLIVTEALLDFNKAEGVD